MEQNIIKKLNSIFAYELDESNFYIKKNTNNINSIMLKIKSSNYWKNGTPAEVLLAWVKTNKEPTYIKFRKQYRKLLSCLIDSAYIKDEGAFILIDIEAFCAFLDNENAYDTLYPVLIDILSSDTFDCCDKFLECSNKKECVHADKLYATASCQYKNKLREGIIFYGTNRNI